MEDRAKYSEAENQVLRKTNDALNEEIIKLRQNNEYVESKFLSEAKARDQYKSKYERIEASYTKLR